MTWYNLASARIRLRRDWLLLSPQLFLRYHIGAVREALIIRIKAIPWTKLNGS
jgi:hypothetical protein